jgi:hypothetical protein
MRPAALALVLIAGCGQPPTEMLIYVHPGKDLQIPAEVHHVHLYAFDRVGATRSTDQPMWDQAVTPCAPVDPEPGCQKFPLSVQLHPGDKRPKDTVRVQVDALTADDTVVISDAALFQFSDKQTFELDFILYRTCLDTFCSVQDKACGPSHTCIVIGKQPPTQDMAAPVPDDLAVAPPDLAVEDLAGADLAPEPPDLLTPADLLLHCGAQGENCCARTPTMTSPGPVCMQLGFCAPPFVCNGTTCVECGILNNPCCGPTAAPCSQGSCDPASCTCQ